MLQKITTTQRPQASIIRHQPELMRQEHAKADAIIEYAKKVKDWPLLEQAVDTKIEQQKEFVAAWQERVRSQGEVHKKTPNGVFFSVDQLEDLTGILQQQQSRWHSATKRANVERYRVRQIVSALRKAGLETEANHRAEGTGENEWFTPPQYIEAARAVLSRIDLDPASHPAAQEWIKANQYFTRLDDGLTRERPHASHSRQPGVPEGAHCIWDKGNGAGTSQSGFGHWLRYEHEVLVNQI